MQNLWKILLVGSVLLNVIAIWGFFHFIKYGGSPLGQLKRILTRTTERTSPKIPYSEDNARIIKEIAEGKIDKKRVVFLGASITRRWDLDKYFPEVNMINRGVGGQLVPSILTRFKRDVIDLKPDAVIIKFCSINIRPSLPMEVLEDGMSMMVLMSKANNIVPIISTIIPAGKPEAHIGDFSVVDTLRKFNNWVREFAETNSLPIMDFAKAIEDENGFLPRDCSVDPVHVNDKGYDILATVVEPVLRETLQNN